MNRFEKRFWIAYMSQKPGRTIFEIYASDSSPRRTRSRYQILCILHISRFLSSAAPILDRSTFYDVSRAHKDRYPMLLIVRCRNSRCRVQKRVEGKRIATHLWNIEQYNYVNSWEGNTTRADFIETLSREADYAQQERKVTRENEVTSNIAYRYLMAYQVFICRFVFNDLSIYAVVLNL